MKKEIINNGHNRKISVNNILKKARPLFLFQDEKERFASDIDTDVNFYIENGIDNEAPSIFGEELKEILEEDLSYLSKNEIENIKKENRKRIKKNSDEYDEETY